MDAAMPKESSRRGVGEMSVATSPSGATTAICYFLEQATRPQSIIEQLKIIEPLTKPAANGRARPTLSRGVPSLLGCGFPASPPPPGARAPTVSPVRGDGGFDHIGEDVLSKVFSVVTITVHSQAKGDPLGQTRHRF
jgi:hypothetical protein